ncbi:uncharacterized protein LOC110679533 [Aedes aegypti]|uniref:Uncharacterized protein n=1 Tax=Aedes aegypti TaxID=7159 RepID=A0A6I8TD72_AEDAE|nr:uncharacterized protein LOC110679533 [Aedes aegypti]
MSGTTVKPQEKSVAPIILRAQGLDREEAVGASAGSRNDHRPTAETARRSCQRLKQKEKEFEETLSLLTKAFKDECFERLKVHANEYKEPLHVLQPKDERIEQLEQEIAKENHDWIMSLVRGAETPVTRAPDHRPREPTEAKSAADPNGS